MGLGSRGRDSARARLGAEEADCTRGAARGSLRHPIPCLLDEADDKFAYFNRFVYLESDDLLLRSGRRWVRAVQGSTPTPYPRPGSPISHSHPGSCLVVWDLC